MALPIMSERRLRGPKATHCNRVGSGNCCACARTGVDVPNFTFYSSFALYRGDSFPRGACFGVISRTRGRPCVALVSTRARSAAPVMHKRSSLNGLRHGRA